MRKLKSVFFATCDQRRTVVVFLILVLGTFALYAPSYFHDFVQYDDDAYVFENAEVQKGLSLHGLVWALADAHVFNYHPLTWLSHMLDCELFGLNPGGHHLDSALMHGVNAGLLFLFLRFATGSLWRSAFAAAIFAWHPMRVESVAWISERKDLLSGFFFILTLWTYACHAKGGQWKWGVFRERRPGRVFYWLSTAFFTLGLLAKPMLVMVPLVLFLLDGWPLRRREVSLWSLCLEKVPYFLLSGAMGLLTVFAQKGAIGAGGRLGLLDRIEGSLVAYLWYLEKLFWPSDLTVLYLRPASFPIGAIASAVLVLAVISIVASLLVKRCPYLLMGWLWFLVTLLPVIGLLPVGLQLTADRYTYLPAMGLFIAVIWGGYEAAMRMGRRWRVVLVGVGVVGLLASAIVTERQLGYWRNTATLMNRALEINPNNYIAHLNLGVYYMKEGNTEAAKYHRGRAREGLAE